MFRRLTIVLALAAGLACQKPVAMIGKQSISAQELDKEVAGDLLKLDREFQQQRYQAKKAKLEEMIQKRVLADKLKAAGVTSEDQLIQKEILPKLAMPSDADLQKFYDDYVRQTGAQLPPIEQIKDQVAMAVQRQRVQEAWGAYLDQAKSEAGVKVFLPAYRVAVKADGPSRGPASAPITIVEFSDFQCPYCIKAEVTVKEVLAAYPDKIRLIYRDFPLPMHPLAPKAAQAAECALDQNKYWELHGKLFEAAGKLDVQFLKQYAREVGLDGDKFDKCLDSDSKKAVVDAHQKAGEALGVNGTPAFFINGRFLNGAVPLDEFRKIIDEELVAKK